MHPSAANAILALLPFILITGINASLILPSLADPCKSWGDASGTSQSGGGSSAPQPGCPDGTRWTTESRASAILRIAWLPIGTIAALAFAMLGLARANAWMASLAIAISIAMGFPLTMGMTVFVAGIPPFALAFLARSRGLAPTPPSIGVGIFAVAAPLALTVWSTRALGEIATIALVIGSVYPLMVIAAGALLIWPRRIVASAPAATS